tara:strand:+ start:591 stop:1577 length:987 start_codon:yes stop_codon:yes gene_type:complete
MIVPSIEYFFGGIRNEENLLDIMNRFKFGDIANIFLTRMGGVAVEFLANGPLRSIERLNYRGDGEIPDFIMENHDRVVELHGQRVNFANFISAALFGRIAVLRHRSLAMTQYVGMNDILAFSTRGNTIITEKSEFADRIFYPKIILVRRNPKYVDVIDKSHIEDAIMFLDHIRERQMELEELNIESCIVMNYQAAILHNQQHFSGSLSLNFAVAEALVHEILLAHGLVSSVVRKPFAKTDHNICPISMRKFKDMRFKSRIVLLNDAQLINRYQFCILESARNCRNNLMHGANLVSPRQSGDMQTAVRDLWNHVVDLPFALIASWSMRI